MNEDTNVRRKLVGQQAEQVAEYLAFSLEAIFDATGTDLDVMAAIVNGLEPDDTDNSLVDLFWEDGLKDELVLTIKRGIADALSGWANRLELTDKQVHTLATYLNIGKEAALDALKDGAQDEWADDCRQEIEDIDDVLRLLPKRYS